jgi:predicted RNA-binding Zn-ribbon protein involved in translation (DUF1610 family)
VEDLTRFFQVLVKTLQAGDPGRLTQPICLGEIRHTILPYRANRRALRLETSEDYELVLLRLCAGDGGLARLEATDVQARFVAEMGCTNPDLSLLDDHADALVLLDPEKLHLAPPADPHLAYAPPDQRVAPPSPVKQRILLSLAATSAGCGQCGGKLPADRPVKFCPQCGANQSVIRCKLCRSELEPGWRHCVNCGAAVA